MPTVFYGAKRYVPNCCPDCGTEEIKGPVELTLYNILKLSYASYSVRLEWDPQWRMRRWAGVCSNCLFRKALLIWDPNNWDMIHRKGKQED